MAPEPEPAVLAAVVPDEPEVVIDKVEEVNVTEQEFDVASVPGSDFYAVQLGNFTDLENAEALKSIIEDAGHEAVIEELADQDPVRYRVISGQRPDQASAEELVEALDNDTGHYGFVVHIGESRD